jgi:hypothetical protein
MRLQTSIPKLDELIGGGIEPTKSLLFYSQPGIDSSFFAQQLLFYRLQEGDHGLYLVNNKIPALVKKKLEEFDWNLERYEKKGAFAFFDCYSGFIGAVSEERFSSNFNLKNIEKNLYQALKKLSNKNIILVIDSLSTFLDLCKPEDLLLFIQEFLKKSKSLKVTPVFLFTEWPYSADLKERIRNLFDCIIDLKAIEKTLFLRSYFIPSKANWLSKLNRQEIPFKILQPGGVRVYIPKILVTGPHNAGKTSFIHSASTKSVSVDRLGTTVALDHGHVDYKGFAVDLFGTPGQERFDPILEQLGGESLGVIIVIDSTNPASFERAKDMLKKTKTEGLPIVVVANKANLKGALNPEQIRKKMQLPKEIPVIPVVAESLKAIREGIKKKQPCKLNKKDLARVLEKLFEVIV